MYAETYQAVPTYQIGGGVSLKVFIFEPDTTILTAWDKSYSFEIGPGKSWHVALSTKQFRDLSGFNDCVQEGELGVLRYYDRGYAQMLCVSECYSEIELELCNCRDMTQTFLEKMASLECGHITMIMCPRKQEEIMRTCMERCKPQCSFTRFNFKKTVTSFPNPGITQYSRWLVPDSNITFDYMRKNYAELSINMGDMTVEHTEIRAKYEIFSATSALGGLLGLFFGGSLLTIYELIELLFAICYENAHFFLRNCTLTKFTLRRVSPYN
ncbi:acid-sensing ion channel 4-like isoform X2 [Symsagittifera roscoffensis]|uniref:acid-sensing ion channel 4-like isoform X2 n=1 Tax=Symsagittifera roscoffensis TaxID=84072 RepID=UPI00307C8879